MLTTTCALEHGLNRSVTCLDNLTWPTHFYTPYYIMQVIMKMYICSSCRATCNSSCVHNLDIRYLPINLANTILLLFFFLYTCICLKGHLIICGDNSVQENKKYPIPVVKSCQNSKANLDSF